MLHGSWIISVLSKDYYSIKRNCRNPTSQAFGRWAECGSGVKNGRLMPLLISDLSLTLRKILDHLIFPLFTN